MRIVRKNLFQTIWPREPLFFSPTTSLYFILTRKSLPPPQGIPSSFSVIVLDKPLCSNVEDSFLSAFSLSFLVRAYHANLSLPLNRTASRSLYFRLYCYLQIFFPTLFFHLLSGKAFQSFYISHQSFFMTSERKSNCYSIQSDLSMKCILWIYSNVCHIQKIFSTLKILENISNSTSPSIVILHLV